MWDPLGTLAEHFVAHAAMGIPLGGVQPLDSDLTAIAALSGTGLAVRTAADTWALRTLQAPSAGLTISNPAGVAGDPTFALANDLAALEGLGSTGIAVRTAADTWAQRTITGSDSRISVTNPGGVAGNIDLTVPGAALTRTNDTNVTLSLGGTPTTALLAATSLTLGWSGVLAATRGGTSNGNATVGDILYCNITDSWSRRAIGSTGDVLTVSGGRPVWAAPVTYTDEQAQDAVGTILVDSTTIDLTYNDGTPSITASVIADSIGPTQIDETASYGWNTGTHTFATETVHNGGIDIGTSGRFDSNVGDASGAKQFLFKPTIALTLTAAQSRSIFRIEPAGSTTPYMEINAEGSFTFNSSAPTGAASSIYSFGGATSVFTNASYGVLFAPTGAFATAGVSLSAVGLGSAGAAANATVVGVFGSQGGSSNTSVVNTYGGLFSIAPAPRATTGYTRVYAGIFGTSQTTSASGVPAWTNVGGIFIRKDVAGTSMKAAYTNYHGIYIEANDTESSNTSAAITNDYGMLIEQRARGSSTNYGIFLNNASSGYKAIAIREAGTWIGANDSGHLDLNADTSVDINNILSITGTTGGGHAQLTAQAVAGGGLATNGYVYADDGTNNVKGIYIGVGANSERVSGMIYESAADKTVVGNAIGSTGDLLSSTCRGTKTLGAGFFDKAGKSIRLKASGYYSTDAAAAGTLQIDFKLGGTTVLSTSTNTMPNNAATLMWEVELLLACRAPGGTSTLIGQGRFTWWTNSSTSNTTRCMQITTSLPNIDTTASQAMSLDATWGTSDADNTITCTNAIVIS